ncbi:hypothetical protein BC629DRAFT_1443321 [Irpex lacteus]|nr:hypothetical protein BC629DRAFT_1443321 [Irpex lacteus]
MRGKLAAKYFEFLLLSKLHTLDNDTRLPTGVYLDASDLKWQACLLRRLQSRIYASFCDDSDGRLRINDCGPLLWVTACEALVFSEYRAQYSINSIPSDYARYSGVGQRTSILAQRWRARAARLRLSQKIQTGTGRTSLPSFHAPYVASFVADFITRVHSMSAIGNQYQGQFWLLDDCDTMV